MPLPDPQPGLVIGYSYLWRSEARAGQDEGRKDRPCVILVAKSEGDLTRVVVAPITHSSPRPGETAIEIPASTKARLNLDEKRSWIVTNEVNAFAWPGPDLRPVDRRHPDKGIAYGYLPSALAKQSNDDVRNGLHRGETKAVKRTDAASRADSKNDALKRLLGLTPADASNRAGPQNNVLKRMLETTPGDRAAASKIRQQSKHRGSQRDDG